MIILKNNQYNLYFSECLPKIDTCVSVFSNNLFGNSNKFTNIDKCTFVYITYLTTYLTTYPYIDHTLCNISDLIKM